MQYANVEIKIKLVKSNLLTSEDFINNDENHNEFPHQNDIFLKKRNILVNYNDRVIYNSIIKNSRKLKFFNNSEIPSQFDEKNNKTFLEENSNLPNKLFVTVIY